MIGPDAGSEGPLEGPIWRRGSLKGRVVLITGASGGIGEATARALSRLGASLVLSARRTGELERVRRSLDDPERHLAIRMDVRDDPSVRAGVAQAASRYGRLDAVVASAGVGAFSDLDATGEEVMAKVVDTNLSGAIRTVRAALGPLRESRGSAVLVGSAAGRRGVPGLSVYSATKAALFGFADALRVELWPDVRVSVVSPDRTDTGFFAAAAGRAPAGPAAPPERAAELIVRALRSGAPALDARPLGALRGGINQLFPRLADAWLRRRARDRGRPAGHP